MATVVPGGLNLRRGPGVEHAVVRVLRRGQRVSVRASSGRWYRVATASGPGYVFGRHLRFDDAGGGRRYVVRSGDTLGAVARRFGVGWRELQALNGIVDPDRIAVDQVLRIPAAAATARTVGVLDPLPASGAAVLTSSSADGHHRAFGGSHSADLDISNGASPGQPVRFNVACSVAEVRAVVEQVGFACRRRPGQDDDARLTFGGRKVLMRIERRDGGVWVRTGARVLYAHLDPVLVASGDVVRPGRELGRLGPAGRAPGVEYDSPCARRSHVHVEGWRGQWVARTGVRPGEGEVMRLAI